ncbi:hypothetical protein PUN28_008445 [Cardiocondyla obscurior]|uniref:Uncharacterized protein n=1 Tax=Cardiocondyla obscurior TaxID=286306 RepID=A0AAW2FYB5_9HYME
MALSVFRSRSRRELTRFLDNLMLPFASCAYDSSLSVGVRHPARGATRRIPSWPHVARACMHALHRVMKRERQWAPLLDIAVYPGFHTLLLHTGITAIKYEKIFIYKRF